MKLLILIAALLISLPLWSANLRVQAPMQKLTIAESEFQCEQMSEILHQYQQDHIEVYQRLTVYLFELSETYESWYSILEPIAKNKKRHKFPDAFFAPIEQTAQNIQLSFEALDEKTLSMSDTLYAALESLPDCIGDSLPPEEQEALVDAFTLYLDRSDETDFDNKNYIQSLVDVSKQFYESFHELEGKNIDLDSNHFDALLEKGRELKEAVFYIKENAKTLQDEYKQSLKRLFESRVLLIRP